MFLNSTVRGLRHVYAAITGSILDILDVNWCGRKKYGKDELGSRSSLADLLKVWIPSFISYMWVTNIAAVLRELE
jgi:hypothetical protein